MFLDGRDVGRGGRRLGVAGILCVVREGLCGRAPRVEGPQVVFWGRTRSGFVGLGSILWLRRTT